MYVCLHCQEKYISLLFHFTHKKYSHYRFILNYHNDYSPLFFNFYTCKFLSSVISKKQALRWRVSGLEARRLRLRSPWQRCAWQPDRAIPCNGLCLACMTSMLSRAGNQLVWRQMVVHTILWSLATNTRKPKTAGESWHCKARATWIAFPACCSLLYSLHR